MDLNIWQFLIFKEKEGPGEIICVVINIMPQMMVIEIDLLMPEYSFNLKRALFENVSELRTRFLVSASVNKTPTNRPDSQYPGSKVVECTSNPQWMKKTTTIQRHPEDDLFLDPGGIKKVKGPFKRRKTSWLRGPEERPLILPQQHLSASASMLKASRKSIT